MKTNKRKVKNALSVSMNFRVDFTWRLGNISQFPSGFCKNCQDFTFCSGYFRERAHGKIHPRKLDKSNRESTFFFKTTAKQSLLSLLQHTAKIPSQYLPKQMHI